MDLLRFIKQSLNITHEGIDIEDLFLLIFTAFQMFDQRARD